MAGGVRAALPISVILAAIDGDEKALNAVLDHYRGYICFLSLRSVQDENGNEILRIDESMQLRLEAKLLYSIVTHFKILPV